MTAQGADVPEGDGQTTARTAASPGASNGADANGTSIAVPAARERARSIPEAAVARLAVYLRALSALAEQDITTVSSEELATAAGVNSAKLRKDLSYIGSYGTRGVGYEVEVLIGQIERTLGLTRKHSVAVVGIGNLGHALANYGGFPGRGFPVSALFDLDDDLVGVPVGGIPVSHIDDIVEVCSEREVTIGVIATPTQGAQEVCDRLVAGGVMCILNFAPIVLQVPEHVEVRKVDLAVEMQILSFHVARRQQEAANAVDGAASDGGPPGGGAGLPGEIDSANRMVERL
ncbi:MAG: redox-sensing transcriptional repressor Rex [Actinomycetota bacterium]|uniref:Redox-sensing transcriptional repressor Rex n=2 Tax=Saccharopolyspora TaxID=1835 RepID=A0A4R4W628_9PSEU|nr:MULTISPECIES: redox-sensing transcriptional repressor Rex [Saccharopolyspora]MDQ4008542.1 redox-sensing transcriptional repressor Rex [Actinomycetota bacterium]TDD10525.1 redox-sensing transcriptional repressor Rex [Saccharopolyspora terrae]TDD92804.1 redox-sensing transcriptional repressor Rex [Saccharopolyspora karakumensis]